MPEATQQRQGQQQGQQEDGSSSMLMTAVRSIAIFLLVQFVTSKLFSGRANNTASGAGNAAIPQYTSRPSASEITGEYSVVPLRVSPIWPLNTTLDIRLYISPSIVMPTLAKVPPESLILEEKQFTPNWKDSRDIHKSFKVPKSVQQNGTLWAHVYVAQSGSALDPASASYDQSKAFYFARPLTQYLRKKRVRKTKSLLSDSSEKDAAKEEEPDSSTPIIESYYHPNFTLSVVPNSEILAYSQVHQGIRDHLVLEKSGARDATGQHGWYYPIVFVNQFWQLRSGMTELNSTVTELPMNIHLNSLSNWKFSVLTSMDLGIKQNQEKVKQGQTLPGGGDGSELEEVKRIILESNIYLLSTTVVVGLLHTVFEMLAFKNDVSHWRKKKDNVGVSVRTILANVFMQAIIFLYLLDNNENTSWMILFGQATGIAIEAWKITKTVNVRVRPTPADSTAFPWRCLPYTVVFEDKHQLSETERKTEEYDQIAFYYLYRIAVPLLIAYAAYSLVYDTHKSWYSFIIETLVGSVYAYGFLMMVPSLYINYRLQSVAHMPGRTMMYKFLNTFIDDLFAFTIKMPILHRLATLRDDVIFFVYLYQKYKYKVDYTRVNEFGQGGDDEAVEEKIANKPLEAPAGGAVADKDVDAAKATGSEKEGSVKKRK